MAWLQANFPMIVTGLLILSEAAGAVCQLVFPDNKGISGVFAGIIKVLQVLGAKPSTPSQLQ